MRFRDHDAERCAHPARSRVGVATSRQRVPARAYTDGGRLCDASRRLAVGDATSARQDRGNYLISVCVCVPAVCVRGGTGRAGLVYKLRKTEKKKEKDKQSHSNKYDRPRIMITCFFFVLSQ